MGDQVAVTGLVRVTSDQPALAMTDPDVMQFDQTIDEAGGACQFRRPRGMLFRNRFCTLGGGSSQPGGR